MDYIQSLADAIKRLHGCSAHHVESVLVKETFRGQTVWEGHVEVFKIDGHPKAKQCYAWSHATGENDTQDRFVTVLELPPVDSARTAVQAAIVQEARKSKP